MVLNTISRAIQRLAGDSPAPAYQGYVDERSTHHIAGWLRNLNDPSERVRYEILFGDKLLHTGIAAGFSPILAELGVGDGEYAFSHEFPTPLTLEQRDQVTVRPAGAEASLELAPALITAPPGQRPAAYQGYLDERSTAHIAGWVRDTNHPEGRVEIEIVQPGAPETLLYRGLANQLNPLLAQLGVGDGTYAFFHRFPQELSRAERDTLFVRPAGSATPLPHAPQLRTAPSPYLGAPPKLYQGYLDERSIRHVSGWVRIVDEPATKLDYEVVLPQPDGTETVLTTGRADADNAALRQLGIGDGAYGFFCLFPAPITPEQRDILFVRPTNSDFRLDLSPSLNAAFEPIHHIAMDIVNNCNLRCPFCVYDYRDTNRTEFMTDETFNRAMALIPFVTEGNFWLSCLHEATLHPKLLDFIDRVPLEYRKKIFFTTNLAKRMPAEYFTRLANSGIHNINISLESLDPAVYERLRKGAKFRFFQEGWDALLSAFAASTAAWVPKIRYNLMAYRSNLHEIPELTAFLLREKSAYQVEIRNTFDGPQIDPAFRDGEFLTTAEWAWLAKEMRNFAPEQVVLLVPPGGVGHDRYAKPAETGPVAALGEPAPLGAPSRPFNIRIAWDGTFNVYDEKIRHPGQPPTHVDYLVTNVHQLTDPLGTLFNL